MLTDLVSSDAYAKKAETTSGIAHIVEMNCLITTATTETGRQKRENAKFSMLVRINVCMLASKPTLGPVLNINIDTRPHIMCCYQLLRCADIGTPQCVERVKYLLA